MDILGIDVGKRDLHAVLLQEKRSASKSVSNSPSGIAQLQTWLKNRKAERIHACLEATGGWSEEVAIALSTAGHIVSLVNPARIKAFAQGELVRTKTDKIDAALIARFCRLHQPDPWTPPAPEILILQRLVRRQQSLIEMRVEEESRRVAPIVSPAVMASIDAMLEQIDNEVERVEREIEQLFNDYPTLRRQRELLVSIPGIAETTAARILGEMPNITEFRDVKAVAAFVGLSPRHYQSGSIRVPQSPREDRERPLAARSLLPSDRGDASQSEHTGVRPAAARSRQVQDDDRCRRQRKLLTLAYGVLKSGRTFDPAYGIA